MACAAAKSWSHVPGDVDAVEGPPGSEILAVLVGPTRLYPDICPRAVSLPFPQQNGIPRAGTEQRSRACMCLRKGREGRTLRMPSLQQLHGPRAPAESSWGQ